MFTKIAEEKWFLKHININFRVLEYGSGESTLQISKICNYLLSIEHNKNYYNKLSKVIPNNCELLLKKPDLEYKEGGDCGTYDEFKTYIEAPIPYGKFDIILIDGRARNSCASICNKLGDENTLVFVHDFNRPEYSVMHNYLEVIDSVETMYKFKIRF